MADVLWEIFAVLLGCFAVYRFSDFAWRKPGWGGALLVFGAGALLGIGATSILFFVMRVIVPGMPRATMIVEIVLLLALGYEAFRKYTIASKSDDTEPAIVQFPFNWILMIALAGIVVVATAIMTSTWDASPQGAWDAWSIWNLRARFLAANGELVSRAWSPMLTGTHPEYPLLTSGFIARCWTYGGSVSTAASIAMPYILLLAMIGLVAGGFSAARGNSLGLLLALALVGTPTLLHEVPSQYADVPLACYFLGAMVLALLNQQVLAGIFAGFAAWTKDEGLLFLAVFLVVSLIFRREQILRLATGVLPGALMMITFKMVIARQTTSLVAASGPGLAQRIAEVSRYGKVIGAFAKEFLAMMPGWYHPIFPAIVLMFVLRFEKDRRRDFLYCAAVCVLMIAGYAAIYIITPNDLDWQLGTSLNRLFVQLWPIVLLTLFVGLRSPESLGIITKVKAPGRNRMTSRAK